jgi:hypothetical protein
MCVQRRPLGRGAGVHVDRAGLGRHERPTQMPCSGRQRGRTGSRRGLQACARAHARMHLHAVAVCWRVWVTRSRASPRGFAGRTCSLELRHAVPASQSKYSELTLPSSGSPCSLHKGPGDFTSALACGCRAVRTRSRARRLLLWCGWARLQARRRPCSKKNTLLQVLLLGSERGERGDGWQSGRSESGKGMLRSCPVARAARAECSKLSYELQAEPATHQETLNTTVFIPVSCMLIKVEMSLSVSRWSRLFIALKNILRGRNIHDGAIKRAAEITCAREACHASRVLGAGITKACESKDCAARETYWSSRWKIVPAWGTSKRKECQGTCG